MEQNASIKIDYWAIPNQQGKRKIEEPEGMAEFREELSHSYVAVARGRPKGLGAGFYEFAVQYVASFTIQDALKFIAAGVAYDLLKSGSKTFVLKPFLAAYEKLKRKNTKYPVDIDYIKFVFQDADVFITRISTDSISPCLEEIFKALAESYEFLKNKNGEFPYTIHIPVFEDPDRKYCRFRMILFDDILKTTSEDYFRYWGVRYDFEGAHRIFDVQKKLLIDETYLTSGEYWEKAHGMR